MGKFDNTSTSKELFKNTGIIAIGQLGTKIVNFFLLPLYTAILTQEEYGLVDLLTTYATFLAVLVGLQLSQGVFRFLVVSRDDKEKTKRLTSTIAAATIIGSLIYTFLFLCVQSFISISCKWYILLHVIVTIYLRTASEIARGYGKNTDYSIANFISASLTIILNVMFLVVLKLGVAAMLWSYIVGPIVGGTYLVFRCGITNNLSLRAISKKEFKSILNYSLPLVPNELSWSVIHSSDRMVVSSFLNIAANGLIAVASKFSVIYTTIFSIFNLSWTEQVVLHYKDDGGPDYINRMFNQMIMFFGSIAICIIAVMPFAFRFLVDAKFYEAYNLVPIYMAAVFFNAVIGLISPIYLANNETKQVAFSTMVAAGVNLFVDIVLIKVVGVYAAPISSLCGYAVISFWRLYDVNKRHCTIKMPVSSVLLLITMLILSCLGFYVRIRPIQVLCAVSVLTITVWRNWKMIISLKSMLKRK